MLKLHTQIDENSGFCFGVVSAIEKVEKALAENTEVICVGEIVHNEQEVSRLLEKGLKTIHQNEIQKISKSVIFFRAHGEPPESYQTAMKNENIIIDATCPIVAKLQQRVKQAYENKEAIMLFGKKNHPEIIGIIGQINNQAMIVESVQDIEFEKLPGEITIFSQTTQSPDKLHEIVNFMKENGIKVKIHNTTCSQVNGRTQKLKEFCRKFDQILFVAGHNSSNGKVLYSVCKENNSKVHFIACVEEIQKDWFKEKERIGICGATSTPLWLMQKVEEKLKSF